MPADAKTSAPAARAARSLERHVLKRLSLPDSAPQPRRVLLFSGHMIDAPGRPEPRFPAALEPAAAASIEDRLAALEAGPADLGLCGGACGGDILFAEACRARGVPIEVRIPLPEARFLADSVAFAGDAWVERFLRVKRYAGDRFFVADRELGALPAGASPHARNNLWQLHAALARGRERVELIALWNGRPGDGPGGTAHMVEEIRRRSGRIHVLDIDSLRREAES